MSESYPSFLHLVFALILFFGFSNANVPHTCPQNDLNRTSVRSFNVKCFKVGYRCTQNHISDATFNVWSYSYDGGDGKGNENVKGSSDPTATLFLSLWKTVLAQKFNILETIENVWKTSIAENVFTHNQIHYPHPALPHSLVTFIKGRVGKLCSIDDSCDSYRTGVVLDVSLSEHRTLTACQTLFTRIERHVPWTILFTRDGALATGLWGCTFA